jgi:ATP-dependent helicase HrpB
VESLSTAPYLVIADTAGAADRARVLIAAPISQREIETFFATEIETRTRVSIDAETGAVRGRRAKMFGRLVLSEGPLESIAASDMEAALLDAVREQGLQAVHWSERAKQLRARVALMRSLESDLWSDWSDEALLGSLDGWLAPMMSGVRRLGDVDVMLALLAALPYELRRRLDDELPERFETPAEASHAIDYTAEGGPALSVRLQELFGMDTHPSVAKGRIPLTLLLLSPAHRPVQTTKDLPGFWRGSYAAVRSDMRGRYPKHPWPEDPLSAPPTRRAKPRGS